tara:strand:+ start:34882 stop:35286 length:405 start_codon:yes stop_codon:yes gene_type:complete
VCEFFPPNFRAFLCEVFPEHLAGIVNAEEFRATRPGETITELSFFAVSQHLEYEHPGKSACNFGRIDLAASWQTISGQSGPVAVKGIHRVPLRNTFYVDLVVRHWRFPDTKLNSGAGPAFRLCGAVLTKTCPCR